MADQTIMTRNGRVWASNWDVARLRDAARTLEQAADIAEQTDSVFMPGKDPVKPAVEAAERLLHAARPERFEEKD